MALSIFRDSIFFTCVSAGTTEYTIWNPCSLKYFLLPFLPEMLAKSLMWPLWYVPVLPNKREKTQLTRQLAAGLTCFGHTVFTFSAEWIKWSTSTINNRSNSSYTLKTPLKPTLPPASFRQWWLIARLVSKPREITQSCSSSVPCCHNFFISPDQDNLYPNLGASCLLQSEKHILVYFKWSK